MKLSLHAILQIIGIVCQGVNALTHLIPPEHQGAVAVTIAATQAAVGAVAHTYNPDGSPAKLPYRAGE